MKEGNTLTKEQYLSWRNQNAPDMIYEFYKDKFDEKKYKNFLNIEDFFQCFTQWPGANDSYQMVIDHYDVQFNVLRVPNKQGQYFMYL